MSKQDDSVVRPTVCTGVEGVKGIVDAMHKATPEMKRLLSEECDVILECKFCRNMFRSMINFLSHKRGFCRSSYIKEDSIKEEENPPTLSIDDNDESDKVAPNRKKIFDYGGRKGKKESSTTRHLNPMNRIIRRMGTTTISDSRGKTVMQLHTLPAIGKIVPNTKFINGMQVVVDPPTAANLTSDKNGDNDHVMMVMPQDCTSAYLNMQLRRRKEKPVAAKKLTENEALLTGRLMNHSDVDPDSNQCNRDQCDIQFDDMKSLAVHTSLYHVPLHPTKDMKNKLLCFLCGETFLNKSCMKKHMLKEHENTKNATILTSDDDDKTGDEEEEEESSQSPIPPQPVSPAKLKLAGKNQLERSTAFKLIKKYSKTRHAITTSVTDAIEDYSYSSQLPRKQYDSKSADKVRCVKCKQIFGSRKSAATHWRHIHLGQGKFLPGKSKVAERRAANRKIIQQMMKERKAPKPRAPKHQSQCEDTDQEVEVDEVELTKEETNVDSKETSPDCEAPKRSARLARRSQAEGKLSIFDKLSKKKQQMEETMTGSSEHSPIKSRASVDRGSNSSTEKPLLKSESATKPNRRDLNSVVDSLVKDVIKHESAEELQNCKRLYKKCKLDEILANPQTDGLKGEGGKGAYVTPVLSLSHAKMATGAMNAVVKEEDPITQRERDFINKRNQLDQIYANSSKRSNAKKKSSSNRRVSAPVPNKKRRKTSPERMNRTVTHDMQGSLRKAGNLPSSSGSSQKPDQDAKNKYPTDLLNYEKDEKARDQIHPPPYFAPPGNPPNWMFVARGIVSLTEEQKDILHSVLDDDQQTCKQCKRRFGSTKLVRTHVMNHIKLARFKCNSCDAASFFCADMRRHLVYGYCPGQQDRDFVKPGDEVNRDNIAEVDKQISLVDPYNPARVEVWTKTVISSEYLGAKCYKNWKKHVEHGAGGSSSLNKNGKTEEKHKDTKVCVD